MMSVLDMPSLGAIAGVVLASWAWVIVTMIVVLRYSRSRAHDPERQKRFIVVASAVMTFLGGMAIALVYALSQ